MSKTSNKLLKALLFVGTAASAMYLFNKYISDFSTSKNKLLIKKDSYFTWKFGRVYYEKSGTGAPLILIHDYSHCGSSYEWYKIKESLSESYTVYTIDLLGCGRSEKPQINYTNFLYVQLLNDFIKEIIQEDTVSIIASGFSTSIAVMTSVYAQNFIDKLVLINPTSINNLSKECTQTEKLFKKVLELPLLGTFIYNLLTTKYSLDKQITENLIHNPFLIDHDMIDTYYEAAHCGKGNGKYVLSSYLSKYMNTNISHALKQLDNDILIIGGSFESNINDIIEEYQTVKPSIESDIIQDTKHLPHFEKPIALLNRLNNFL